MANNQPKEVLKAYECTYFRWIDIDCGKRDAYYETYYGKTAGEAKIKFYNRNDLHDTGVRYIDIKARRNARLDMIENIPHPLLEVLTKQQVDKMKHTVGFDCHMPFYRNHYQIDIDSDFEDLIQRGLASKETRGSLNYYELTPKGVDVLKSLLPVIRHSLGSTVPEQLPF